MPGCHFYRQGLESLEARGLQRAVKVGNLIFISFCGDLVSLKRNRLKDLRIKNLKHVKYQLKYKPHIKCRVTLFFILQLNLKLGKVYN